MGFPARPEMDAAFRMTPLFRLTISRATAWRQKNVPRALMPRVRSHSASVSLRGSRTRVIPALLTRISIFPKALMAVSTIRWMSAMRVTSICMGMPVRPRIRISLAVPSDVAASRSGTRMSAPSRANRRAVTLPMPRPAPVTMALFPASRMEASRPPPSPPRVELRSILHRGEGGEGVRSSLEGPQGQAPDDMLLDEQGQDQDRQRDDGGRCREATPVDLLIGKEIVHRDGQGARLETGDDQSEEKGVPGEDGGEGGGGHDARLHQRQGHPQEGREVGTPVDSGRLEQLPRHVLEKADHHPQDEGQRHDQVGQDQRRVGVDHLQLGEEDEPRSEEHTSELQSPTN